LRVSWAERTLERDVMPLGICFALNLHKLGFAHAKKKKFTGTLIICSGFACRKNQLISFQSGWPVVTKRLNLSVQTCKRMTSESQQMRAVRREAHGNKSVRLTVRRRQRFPLFQSSQIVNDHLSTIVRSFRYSEMAEQME